jgi:hypothetical protein
MNRKLMFPAIGMCVLLAGCATMSNPGRVHTVVSPEGLHVKVASLYLKGTNGHLDIYEGNRRLEIREGTGDHESWVRMCRAANNFGDGGACEDAIFFPMLELDRGVPHTLRMVHNGQEATVTVEAHMHWGWIWANGVWFAAAPIGWAVDAASGDWSYFSELDVARTFRDAASAQRRGTQ